MELDDIDDDTLDQLADRLAERLDPGAYGDRVMLSRRQLVGVATGVLGTGALLSLGVDPAAAQAAGSVGTSSDPVDVNAYDLDVANGVTSSLAMNGNDITGAGSVSTGRFPNASTVVCETSGKVEDAISDASDGDRIIINAGSYAVNNPLDIDAEIIIKGGGRERTTLNKQNDSPLIRIQDSRVIIEDLSGVGLGSNTGTTVGILAVDDLATRTHLSRVGMNDMGSHGFHIRKGNLSRYEEISAENNGENGIHHDEPGGDNNAVLYTQPNLKGNDGDGFHQEGGYNVEIIGGYSAGNGRHGWYCDDNNCRYIGIGGEGNSSELLYFDENADEGYAFLGVGEGPYTDVNGNNHVVTTSTTEIIHSGGARYRSAVVLDEAYLKGVNSAGEAVNLIRLAQSEGDAVAVGEPDEKLRTKASSWILSQVPNNTNTDSMTRNPETDAEDAFITVNVGGTDYQIPLYES